MTEQEQKYIKQGYTKIQHECKSEDKVYWTQVAFYKPCADFVFIYSFYLKEDGSLSEIKGKGHRTTLNARKGYFIWNRKRIKV